MVNTLHKEGLPGSPRRIRNIARELSKYDYSSSVDFIGCDLAPLPPAFLEYLSDGERAWFSIYVAKVNSRPIVHHGANKTAEPQMRPHTPAQFNGLKASLNCLDIRRDATKEVRREALCVLADLGIRSWADLIGKDDSFVSTYRLKPERRRFCVDVIDAAHVHMRRHEGAASSGRTESGERAAKISRTICKSPPRSTQESSVLTAIHIMENATTRPAFDARGIGPARAVSSLAATLNDTSDCKQWISDARVQAVLGSCPRSHKSIVSGLRCWYGFAHSVLKQRSSDALPPSVDGLLAWSSLFRCGATYGNYVNYVRIGCDLVQASAVATRDPCVKRAQIAVDKRRQFNRRERLFIQLPLLRRVMQEAVRSGDVEFAMAILCSYVCLAADAF